MEMAEEGYIKVPIYPLARYLPPGEQAGMPSRKVPHTFLYNGVVVTVDEVVGCERTVSHRVSGRGFVFSCRVSWGPPKAQRSQNSAIWHDDFYDGWFLEVPQGREPPIQQDRPPPCAAGPGGKPGGMAGTAFAAGPQVRVPIYPLVRYLRPEERKAAPSNKVPHAFVFNGFAVEVEAAVCERVEARKAREGGEGLRFSCRTTYRTEGRLWRRHDLLWYDEQEDAWYLDVPDEKAPRDWYSAAQV